MLSDREILVNDNLKLAYFIANKWNIKLNGKLTIDELKSDCTLGLFKASKGFKTEKNISFATYSVKCMQNEILMRLRSDRREVLTVPISSLVFDVGTDKEYNAWEKMQALEARNNIDEWINYIATKEIVETVIKSLNPKQQYIMKLCIKGISQKKIAEKIHFAQSYVSRIEMKVINKIKRRIKQDE